MCGFTWNMYMGGLNFNNVKKLKKIKKNKIKTNKKSVDGRAVIPSLHSHHTSIIT